MFELSQLRCFVAAAEELNFSRAAVRLNMTQPPLGRQIRLLEHHVGTRLFEREGRGVRLTAAGRAFLPDARAVIAAACTAIATARRVRDGRGGVVRIGFTAAAGHGFAPRLVTRMRQAAPDVDLLLHEMVSDAQIEALLGQRIDLALLRPGALPEGLVGKTVAREPMMAALPAGDPRAALAAVPASAFDGAAFIAYAPGAARYFRGLTDTFFAAAGIVPRQVQELAQIHSIVGLVGAGAGAAIVPASAMTPGGGAVVFRPLEPGGPEAVLDAAWRRDAEHPLVAVILRQAALMEAGE